MHENQCVCVTAASRSNQKCELQSHRRQEALLLDEQASCQDFVRARRATPGHIRQCVVCPQFDISMAANQAKTRGLHVWKSSHGARRLSLSCAMLDSRQARSVSVHSCRLNGLNRKFGVRPHCRQHRRTSVSHKLFYHPLSKVTSLSSSSGRKCPVLSVTLDVFSTNTRPDCRETGISDTDHIMDAPREVARSGSAGEERDDARAPYAVAKHYSCFTYTDPLEVTHVLCVCACY
jgi:hypothetical protein